MIDGTSGTNTFAWYDNYANPYPGTTGVAITGSAQALEYGVTVTFSATTGGHVGDAWYFTNTVLGSSNFGWACN
jgi:hypothetical protein